MLGKELHFLSKGLFGIFLPISFMESIAELGSFIATSNFMPLHAT